jgi:osmotically-inducible protein OsmY
MIINLTSLDQSLRDAVMHQLEWDPEIDAELIGVSAQDGVAVLTGYVNSYAGKLAAERSARKVFGVKAVVNELEVRLAQARIDPDIAKDTLAALENHVNVPKGIGVTVRDGHVTLSGRVEWMFEKVAAERAVKHLRGVRGVFNQIEIAPKVTPRDVQKRITQALHRQADLDARRIHVEAVGGVVKLTGSVRTWCERNEAVRSAWGAPGVTAVESQIDIVP